ncbi:Bug family tripartite tricarboxylate transporter substrate binding protein [Modicisalibacter radicis]|uniref:Bug family tripartite tricarboxylate transporter substrate binding protein n=1 Tax=Halomonas sp. EAR18 TaxID=2518972 RepID=UPI00109C52BA|nr:tripartite tricarboxylate transporter substrate binding protein [Halomonas sp. EAR18]
MKSLRCTLAALTLAGAAHSALAADTLDIIVPFSAGGATDIVARSLEPILSRELGVTSVIRNVAGASATLGTIEVANSQGNPNILEYVPAGALSIQPTLKSLPYELDSFRYICRTVSNPMYLMVSKSSGIKSFPELVNRSKERSLLYGSSGPGTLPHLAMAALVVHSQLDARHIPYRGTGNAMNALAGDEIQVVAGTDTILTNYDLRPLAIFALQRDPNYADVPTIKELGVGKLEFSVWQGLIAPEGISEKRFRQYSEACEAALKTPEFREFADKANVNIAYLDQEEFKKFVTKRYEDNKSVLETSGLIK